eukprot:COSAG01_NODE_1999_length_8688_cov_6.237280_1_plen_292_part_00
MPGNKVKGAAPGGRRGGGKSKGGAKGGGKKAGASFGSGSKGKDKRGPKGRRGGGKDPSRKGAAPSQVSAPGDDGVGSSESELDEGDMEGLDEYAAHTGFLQSMDSAALLNHKVSKAAAAGSSQPSKKRKAEGGEGRGEAAKKKKREEQEKQKRAGLGDGGGGVSEEEEEVADYERAPRRQKAWVEKEREALPVRGGDGKWCGVGVHIAAEWGGGVWRRGAGTVRDWQVLSDTRARAGAPGTFRSDRTRRPSTQHGSWSRSSWRHRRRHHQTRSRRSRRCRRRRQRRRRRSR